jgi:uncharacterized protein YjlB
MTRHIEPHVLDDDGLVPNNPRMPLLVYRGAFDTSGLTGAEAAIEAHFASHGWRNAWVNGIYDFHHYHATAHEVLGIARGHAEVQFGGPSGPVVRVTAGDAVMIPAGVAHCRKSCSSDFSVVGAYPGGADWDLKKATPQDREQALKELPRVGAPATDPVLGSDGPAAQSRP